MARRGIPIGELRPFSVEDPFGQGIGGPTAADLQMERVRAGLSAAEAKRLERSDERQRRQRQQNVPIPGASLVQGFRALESTAPPARQRPERRPRPAPRAPVAPPGAPSKTKKGRGLGCFTTILLVWGLVAGGQFLFGPVLREAKQWAMRELGDPQRAQIVSVSPTDEEFNERRVYEVSVRIVDSGSGKRTLSFEQALSAELAERLTEDSWVEIRSLDEDFEGAVITRVDVPPPDQQEGPGVALEPAPASPEPTNGPAKQADDPPLSAPDDSTSKVSAVCLQVQACCQALQPNNRGCAAFVNPNISEKVCARSLETFKAAANAMGKTCDVP